MMADTDTPSRTGVRGALISTGLFVAVAVAAYFWSAGGADLSVRLGWSIRFEVPGAVRPAHLLSLPTPWLVFDIPKVSHAGRQGLSGQIYLRPLATDEPPGLECLTGQMTMLADLLRLRLLPMSSRRRTEENERVVFEVQCAGTALAIGRLGVLSGGDGFIAVLVTDAVNVANVLPVFDALTGSVRSAGKDRPPPVR